VVTVRVAGIPGTATTGYASPALPKPAPKPVVHKTAPAKPKGFPVPAAVLSPQPPVALAAASANGSSFWKSSHSVVIVALIVAALLGLALVLLLSPLTKRAVHTRVETFIASEPEPVATALDDVDAPRGRLAKALAQRPWWPEFLEQIDVGRVRRSPEQLVRLAIVISLGSAVLGTLLVGTVLVAIPLLLAGPFAVRAGVRHAAKRQRSRFVEQLPAHLQDLAGAMRAGRSLVGALAAVAETADEPIKGELDRALADERLGLPLEQTLTAIGKRMHSEDIEQVALIAALNRRAGSNVAEALDQVAEGSRERADMRRELTAMTGQARISSWVLTALPPVLLLAITLIDPKYASPLYHSVPGALVLIVAGLMVMAGWFVMKKIVDVEV
jgi:tight adherence protein B